MLQFLWVLFASKNQFKPNLCHCPDATCKLVVNFLNGYATPSIQMVCKRGSVPGTLSRFLAWQSQAEPHEYPAPTTTHYRRQIQFQDCSIVVAAAPACYRGPDINKHQRGTSSDSEQDGRWTLWLVHIPCCACLSTLIFPSKPQGHQPSALESMMYRQQAHDAPEA